MAYFDYDKSELLPAGREVLEHNAVYLKKNPDMEVLVEGHCDECGTTEYNLALGQRRASVMREYSMLGVLLKRTATISYGSEKPADPGHNETATS